MGPIFDYQVLVKRKESAFDFYLNFKLKACKPQEFHTKNQHKKTRQENKSLHKLYTKTLYRECLYLTSACFSPSLNLIWNVSQTNLTLTNGVYIFKNYLIFSWENDKTLQLIYVKCIQDDVIKTNFYFLRLLSKENRTNNYSYQQIFIS